MYCFKIIDPWGKILAECPKYRSDVPINNSVAVAEIDQDLIKKVREEMPVYQHRRNDIYALTQLNIVPNNITRETFSFANKIIPASTVFYQSAHSYAFTNIRCVVPGRILFFLLTKQKKIEKSFLTNKNRCFSIHHTTSSTFAGFVT